jgi:alpha-beta hydrolase superfamily lysophospholipase
MRGLVGGCAAGVAAAALALGAPAAGAESPPPLSSTCGDAPGISAPPTYVRTADGVDLYTLDAGSGSTAVVLVHESPANLCGWLPYIPTLTAAGFRVLAFDLRGFGHSGVPPKVPYRAYDRDLAAIVAHARARGAQRVFLLGASYGGAVSLTYAPRLKVDGVVSLSGETYLPSTHANPLLSAPRLHVPLLIVGTRHDRYLPVEDALGLLRKAATRDKRTALYPGGWHGWGIVEDAPYAASARALIAAWLRARS